MHNKENNLIEQGLISATSCNETRNIILQNECLHINYVAGSCEPKVRIIHCKNITVLLFNEAK